MKNRRKAFLLSALVLPGLGQITLKRYKTGIVIILAVLFGLFQMMSIAMEQANEIVNKVIAEGGALDITAISNAATQASNSTANFYLWLIVACWAISLLDVWLVGRKGEEGK